MEQVNGKLLYPGEGTQYLHDDSITALTRWLEQHPGVPFIWEPLDAGGDLRFILMLVPAELSGVGYPTWVIITYYKLHGQYRQLMGMSPIAGLPDAGTLDLFNGLNAIRAELPRSVYGSTNSSRLA